MNRCVLIIGESWFENAPETWQKYGCDVVYIKTITDAIFNLVNKDYCLIILLKAYLNGDLIPALTKIRNNTSITLNYNVQLKIKPKTESQPTPQRAA